MVISFRSLPLVFLSVRFQFDEQSHAPDTQDRTSSITRDIDAYLLNMNFEGDVQSLATFLPLLEHICVQFKHNQLPDQSWVICRVSSGPASVRRLSASEMKELYNESPFAEKLCNRISEQI